MVVYCYFFLTEEITKFPGFCHVNIEAIIYFTLRLRNYSPQQALSARSRPAGSGMAKAGCPEIKLLAHATPLRSTSPEKRSSSSVLPDGLLRGSFFSLFGHLQSGTPFPSPCTPALRADTSVAGRMEVSRNLEAMLHSGPRQADFHFPPEPFPPCCWAMFKPHHTSTPTFFLHRPPPHVNSLTFQSPLSNFWCSVPLFRTQSCDI